MIECLVCHVDKRFTVDMMLGLEIFSMINFNTLQDQVPPYIPSLMSDNDVSNFPILERVRPALNRNDFKASYECCCFYLLLNQPDILFYRNKNNFLVEIFHLLVSLIVCKCQNEISHIL